MRSKSNTQKPEEHTMRWQKLERTFQNGLALHHAGTPQAGAHEAGVYQAEKNRPVVFLHGVGLCADMWQGFLPLLSPQYRLLLIDLPGHGASARPKGEVSLQSHAELILPLIPEGAFVIGHSFGAILAFELARLRPSVIAGLGIMNAIYRRSALVRKKTLERATVLIEQSPNEQKNFFDETLTRWFGSPPEDFEAEKACRLWLNDTPREGYAESYGLFALNDGPEDDFLENLPCPVLFMTGRNDPHSTPAMAEKMAARLSSGNRGHLHIVEGAAHMMPMTHSTETASTLLTFLQNQNIGEKTS